MKLYLQPNSKSSLASAYDMAFNNARELFILSAYLTHWDSSRKLNQACKNFRLIVGKDFGITRKEACRLAMKWLPPSRKAQFLVADSVSGFHPKVAFWNDKDGQTFMIVGSSNLSKAAFDSIMKSISQVR